MGSLEENLSRLPGHAAPDPMRYGRNINKEKLPKLLLDHASAIKSPVFPIFCDKQRNAFDDFSDFGCIKRAGSERCSVHRPPNAAPAVWPPK